MRTIFLTAAALAAALLSHPQAITNPYLPLGSLKQDILEGREGGKPHRVVRTALPGTKTFTINDKKVDALIVEDLETTGGAVSEITKDYFAQDDNGNVYYLGEEVDQYKNGKVVAHEGAWMLGKDTKVPGILMPAHPKVGDRFRSEDVPKITTENDEVVSTRATATVNGKTYRNCVRIKETTSDGVEYKLYAPGVGVIQEGDGRDALRLVSHTVKAGKLR
jgi:hypothetical protein